MLFKLEINNKPFKVVVADTDASRYKGLSNLPKLGKHKGMLFIFPDKMAISMVMRDMLIPLDFIFLDENFKVTQTGSLDADSKNSIDSFKDVQMVLELNKGMLELYNISVGDTLKPEKDLTTQVKGVKKFKHGGKFEMVGEKVYEVKVDDIKIDPKKLQILNNEGEVVANIDSGSRIFSREDTEVIIKNLKKGDKEKLAEYMIATIDKQDSQQQDYVAKK